jgi:putative heme-binding domain-containing protein
MEQLRDRVRNSETESQCRLDLIRTLPFGEATESAATLLELGFSGSDTSIKLAAFDALVSLSDPLVGQKVIAEFAAQTPQIRRALLEVLLANEERIALLLDRIEQGIIKTTEIDAIRQNRLMKQGNPLLRTRAEKLFAVAIDLDRASVLEKYQGALDQPGEAERGRAIFEKNCVTCHRVGNLGVNVGPDISDTRDKLPPYLLMNILDPNRAVDGNYFGYTLVTEQGKSYTGLIKSETATSLTIRMPEGKEVTVLRTEVEALKTGGQSLMPVGFEKTITVEQMSDLISYLKNWRYLDGSIPLR